MSNNNGAAGDCQQPTIEEIVGPNRLQSVTSVTPVGSQMATSRFLVLLRPLHMLSDACLHWCCMSMKSTEGTACLACLIVDGMDGIVSKELWVRTTPSTLRLFLRPRKAVKKESSLHYLQYRDRSYSCCAVFQRSFTSTRNLQS